MNSIFRKHTVIKQSVNLGLPQTRWRTPIARWVMGGLFAIFSLGIFMPMTCLAKEPTVIDVLVVYTSNAKNKVETIKKLYDNDNFYTDIVPFIDDLVDRTNLSYVDSGVNQQLRKVHTEEVSYDENDFDWNDTLTKLIEGNVDNVHELREQYLADVVVFLVNGGGEATKGCGIAPQMDSIDGSDFGDSAFAVVKVEDSCLNGSKLSGRRAFAHQLGHLMGCTDDQGYVTAENGNCTIMWTPKEDELGFRIDRWSNPDITYDREAIGTNDANCANILNNTAETVANFLVPENPGTLQFAVKSQKFNENAGAITVEATRTDGKDGEVSVAVTVGTGSKATAGSDYTITSPMSLVWDYDDDSNKTITVSIIDDGDIEEIENIVFKLSNPTGGATVGTLRRSEVLIEDNDGANIAYIIDNTGSMGFDNSGDPTKGELVGIRKALSNYIQKMVDGGKPPPFINFMTFKDNVRDWGTTNDLATVQMWVDNLLAAGGDECPEASVEALEAAIPNLRPKAKIFLATDASPHPGLDLDATIAKLKAKGIRFNVLLSGDCVVSETKRGSRTPVSFASDDPDSTSTTSPPVTSALRSNKNNNMSAKEVFSPAPLIVSDNHDSNSPAGPALESGDVMSAREAYSRIAYETGGSFVFMPEVNDGSELNAIRFQNSIFNIMMGANLPAVTDITPNIAVQGGTLDITINASNTNFNDSSSVSLGEGIVVNGVDVISATQIIANLTVPPSVAPGFYDVNVTTSLGAEIETAEGMGALLILLPGDWSGLLSVTPFTGIKGTTETVKISGFATNFDDTSVLSFNDSGIKIQGLEVHSPTFLTAEIEVTSEAQAGLHNVQVTTADEVAERWNIFLVLPEIKDNAVPKITAITPSQGARGTTLDLEISGTATGFSEDSFLEFSGNGIAVLWFDVISATQAVATIEIASEAGLGYRDVLVNTGEEVAVLLNGFEVAAELPEITQVTPKYGYRGKTLAIEITGLGTNFLAGESVVNLEGTDITVVPPATVNSPTEIIANIQVGDFAALGWRSVSVTTGAEVVQLHDGFKIMPAIAPVQEEISEKELEQANLYIIKGYILDDEASPIDDVMLQVEDETAKTDALGYWEIVGLAAGEYTIVASIEGYTFVPTHFTLGDGGFIVDITVELATGNDTDFEFKQTYANNMVADGFVDKKEWSAADYAVDLGGADYGTVYAMGRRNYPVNGHKYKGCFLFLLHNIELLTTQYEADYNVFDIYPADDPNSPVVTVWVFNDIDNSAETDLDWLEPAGLSGDFSELDDRGFIVYNYELGEYRQWLPEEVAPAEGTYDWDVYWGLHAMGGFNNSAFEQGLPEAIDNDNALYEVIYRAGGVDMCKEETPFLLRRSIMDPDDRGPTFPLIPYWEGEIELNGPLSVTLSSFTVQAVGDGKVTLNWMTGTETNNAGFFVWRAQPLNGECSNDPNNYTDVKAMTPLIDSKGTEVSGASYSNKDDDVVSGNIYCYVLEDVDYEGKSTFHLDKIISAAP